MPPTPTRERSDNPTKGRREAPSKAGTAAGSLIRVPSTPRPSPEVVSLIHRLKELVAERRRVERSASSELLEGYRVEIGRLQRRLASVVRRELAH